VADGDPDGLAALRAVGDAVRQAERVAVAGLRHQGHSDAVIGRELGTSKQAIQQRFPRGGAGAPTPGTDPTPDASEGNGDDSTSYGGDTVQHGG
jgi:hypothetical protein